MKTPNSRPTIMGVWFSTFDSARNAVVSINALRTARMMKGEPSFYRCHKYYVSPVSNGLGFTVGFTSLLSDEYDNYCNVDCSGTMIPQKPKPKQQLPPSIPLRPKQPKRKLSIPANFLHRGFQTFDLTKLIKLNAKDGHRAGYKKFDVGTSFRMSLLLGASTWRNHAAEKVGTAKSWYGKSTGWYVRPPGSVQKTNKHDGVIMLNHHFIASFCHIPIKLSC